MLSPLQLILPGMVLFIAALLLRRGMVRARLFQPRDVSGELSRDVAAAEQSSAARPQQTEVRLYNYGREVDGRIETNLALLDRLINEAGEEIARLESLLEESRRAFPGANASSAERAGSQILTPEQRRMICFLAMAGYRTEEIARLVDRPAEAIRQVLFDDPRGASAA